MKKQLLIAVLASAVSMPAFASGQSQSQGHEQAKPAAQQQQAQTVELKDGTQIQIKGDEVFVVGKDGSLTPAPDGSHAAKDGSTINTKGGKIAK